MLIFWFGVQFPLKTLDAIYCIHPHAHSRDKTERVIGHFNWSKRSSTKLFPIPSSINVGGSDGGSWQHGWETWRGSWQHGWWDQQALPWGLGYASFIRTEMKFTCAIKKQKNKKQTTTNKPFLNFLLQRDIDQNIYWRYVSTQSLDQPHIQQCCFKLMIGCSMEPVKEGRSSMTASFDPILVSIVKLWNDPHGRGWSWSAHISANSHTCRAWLPMIWLTKTPSFPQFGSEIYR